jgi:transposase
MLSNPSPIKQFDRKALEAFSKDMFIDLVLTQQKSLLAYQERIVFLEKRVEELERRLGQNSSNSSRPPSSDFPGNPPPPKPSRKSKRSPGAQPGHAPHWRALVPEEDVTRIHRHRPTRCHACGLPLSGDDPHPVRHQYIDLPPIVPEVVEHQCHALTCSCGAVTRAALPPELPDTPFGSGLVAMTATLTGACHLSKRRARDFLNDALNVPISLGGVSNCEAQTVKALAEPVAEIREYIQGSPVAYADETRFGLGHHQKGWLWVMAVPLAMMFVLARNRATEAARRLVGSFRGVLVTDRYGAYNAVTELRQVCWAHLKRDFQALSERSGLAGRLGKKLLEEHRKLFRLWHRVRDGTLSREKFSRRISPIRRRIHDLLFDGVFTAEADAQGVFMELWKAEKWFWTFAEVEGVEPTNNEAERCIRKAVLWRKGSFGVWSDRGARYVEYMLTVTGTCRKQGRQVYSYLREAISAYHRGDKAPSLLPAITKTSSCHKIA